MGQLTVVLRGGARLPCIAPVKPDRVACESVGAREERPDSDQQHDSQEWSR
jgi:hypothetical protein